MIAILSEPPVTSSRIGDGESSSTGGRLTKTGDAARAGRIFECDIEFIPNPMFAESDAEEAILGSRPVSVPKTTAYREEPSNAPSGASPYLAALYETRLLGAEEERDLFRRMNFLKHCAEEIKTRLDPSRPDRRLLRRIEGLLAESQRIRDEIIHANLRLVVSIAKRFVDPFNRLHELISSGNLTLMRSVEKFDFARGFRFSTYATWALRREFYRASTKTHRELKKFVTGKERIFSLTPDHRSGAGEPQRLARLRGALDRMMAELPQRERLIVSQRHGLDNGGQPQSLQKIADKLGLCKERVRQLQVVALEKLQVLARQAQLEPPPG